MKWTDEQVEKLRQLADTGMSWRLIGAELGRSGDAVWRYANKTLGLGAKPFNRPEYTSPIWTLIQRACADGKPRSVHEIVEMVNCARSSVDRLMKLYAERGQAHVKVWQSRGAGAPTPLWLPVPGKSKRKPKPLGANETQRRRRAKLKAVEPVKHEIANARDYFQRAAKGGSRNLRPVIGDIFGRAA